MCAWVDSHAAPIGRNQGWSHSTCSLDDKCTMLSGATVVLGSNAKTEFQKVFLFI